MKKLAEKRFINKGCIVYVLPSCNKVSGILREISDTAIYIEHQDKTFEIIPFCNIQRIREHPIDQDGRKVDLLSVYD